MASFIEGSSSNRIVIACDATKSREFHEFKGIIANVRMRRDVIQEGDTIAVLGALHKVLHPMGFQIQVGNDSFIVKHARAIEEEASRKVDAYADMLQSSAAECEGEKVDIEVNVAVGAPMRNVIVQEIVASNAVWAVLDRPLRKDISFYLKHLPCKVAVVRDNLSLEVLRPYCIMTTKYIKHKLLYSLSKLVMVPPAPDDGSDKNSVISLPASPPKSSDIPKNSLVSSKLDSQEQKILSLDGLASNPQQEITGSYTKSEKKNDAPPPVMQKGNNEQTHPDVPVVRRADQIKMSLNLIQYNYSEVQTATDNFASENLLEEGGCEKVYKGQLKDGQFIALKVHNEANKQCFAEFQAHLSALSFARHTNIVTVLGYCFKENRAISVYDYVWTNSLEWHLFDNTTCVLEWHQRHAIAIGMAKGLHFLHEKCRGSPTIHRDVRPSNVLLTYDFVPLLGDFGLAKWKTQRDDDNESKILDNLGYIAPEYAENGSWSVKTDVYAFGIVLIQLISGRKAIESTRGSSQQSLREWASQLIETLEFDEIVDPRLGDLYSTFELYNMARAAYLCVQTQPGIRPTTGEVLRILEGGENDHLRHTKSNLYPPIRC